MSKFLGSLLVFLLVLECSLSGDGVPWHQHNSPDSAATGIFNVLKHEYTFSTEFELEWQGLQYARALKSSFHVRTHYDLYDKDGELSAKAVGSWIPSLGLGWLYSWAANLLIYDRQGYYVGSIDGTLYTHAVAKFIFTDAENNRIAVAYMDNERKTFTIHNPTNITKKIVEVERQVMPYRTDYWKVFVFEDEVLPPEMVQVFAIFACDRQNDFMLHK